MAKITNPTNRHGGCNAAPVSILHRIRFNAGCWGDRQKVTPFEKSEQVLHNTYGKYYKLAT